MSETTPVASPDHLKGCAYARIPSGRYAQAKQLARDLDQLLHGGLAEAPFNSSITHLLTEAHGLVHDLAHAMVDVDDPNHPHLHPEEAQQPPAQAEP